MTDFTKFSKAFDANFKEMVKKELLVSSVSGNQVWEAYLAAFPEGYNEILEERTEYDCQCCKNFIRRLGNVVYLENGVLVNGETVFGVLLIFKKKIQFSNHHNQNIVLGIYTNHTKT